MIGFYRAASVQGGLSMNEMSVRLSICLSVRLSNAWIDKTKEMYAKIFILRKRYFLSSFLTRKWLVGATPYTWNFGANWPCWSKNADFQSIFARSALAVTPNGKSSINTNRKSTTRFPMSLRWTSYVAPKGLKTQNGRFPRKIALQLKKVCYKVSLCEYYQRQSCKTFTGLSIRAKMVRGGLSVLRENLPVTDPPNSKRWFSMDFRS